MSTERNRDTITVLKDVTSFCVGLGLIIRQGWFVSAADFNWIALVFGGILIQVPGVTHALGLLRSGTGSAGSLPLPEEPQPQSPSSPTV